MMNENENQVNALDALTEMSNQFTEAFELIEKEQERYWNSLTKEQQLMVFCAISRRIVEGELEAKGSYRYILYEVFGFGPEAYAPAQMAGYMTLHNSIHSASHDIDLLTAFCKKNKINSYKQKIDDFLT